MNRFSFTIVLIVLLGFFHSIQAQEDLQLEVYHKTENGEINVYVNNPHLFPQTLVLNLNITGLKPKKAIPEFIVIPPEAHEFLLSSLVIPERKSWSFKYQFNYFLGDASAVHDDAYAYSLPFERGQSYVLSQGYNGQQTHQGKNALDFTMPEGTTVLAARAGRVVRVKEDSNRGCNSERCKDMGNLVTILHDDNTMADYLHLKYQGALVKPGDYVEVGDKIGLSGSTGWSSGPHLHFMVYKANGTGMITIPTQFKTADNNMAYLKVGVTYTSVE